MNFISTCIVLSSLFFNSINEPIKYNSFQSDQDSLAIWIKESRDNTINHSTRKALLEKAYAYSLNEKNDSLRNVYFLRIAYTYYKFDDSLAFRRVNKKSIVLSRKLNDSVNLAANYWDLGRFYSNNALLDSAYYSFSEAQRLYETLNNDEYSARMLLNMAIAQSDAKDFTGSEITTIKAISILKPLDKYKHLYRCYNNLGINFNNLEEYDKAIENHLIALEYEKKIKGTNTYKETSLNNLGVVFKNNNDFEKAIQYYTLALKTTALKSKNTNLYAKLLDNLAYSKLMLKDTLGVRTLFYRSLKIRDSINDYLGLAVNKLHLAEYYAILNDSAKATQFALETKELAKRTKNYRDLLASLQLLSKLDNVNGINHANEYIQLNDSLQKEERAIRNKFARIQFETNETLYQNERLSREKQLLFLAFGLFFALSILLFVVRNERVKNKTLQFEQQQQRANEEIYSLMLTQQEKLDEGSRKEKKRISEELHDGVLGKLFGTRLILGTLNTNNDEKSISEREKYISDLQEIEEEVRNVSHELNSESKISNISYIHLVDDLLESQSKISNFTYETTYDKTIIWDEISSGLKMNLYRIIQEAMQNINKYAKAEHVYLTFKIDKKQLSLSIKDDGIGFNTEVKRKGIGLKNMNSRVAKFNGKLIINSKKDSGASILITIPLNN